MPLGKEAQKLPRLTRQRISHVQSLMASMFTDKAIADHCAQAWGVTERYVREVIRLAHEDFVRRSSGQNEEQRRALLRMSAEAVHQRAIKDAADPNLKPEAKAPLLKVQLQSLEFLARLDGVIKPARLEIGGSAAAGLAAGMALGSLGLKGPEEVRARIEELRQKQLGQAIEVQATVKEDE